MCPLERIGTTVHKFPANCTDILQSSDGFVIQKMKVAWNCHWGQYKSGCVRAGFWTAACGLLSYHGMHFPQLDYKFVWEVNLQPQWTGATYACRAIIRSCMSRSFNGRWERDQKCLEFVVELVTLHRSPTNSGQAAEPLRL